MKKKSVKYLLHFMLLCMPLLLLLIACIFPSKQINNTYALVETTTNIEKKYQTNQLNTYEDLIEGNIYEMDIAEMINNGYVSTTDLTLDLINFKIVNADDVQYDDLVLPLLSIFKYDLRYLNDNIFIHLYDIYGGSIDLVIYSYSNVYVYFVYNEELSHDLDLEYGILDEYVKICPNEYIPENKTTINNTYNQESLTQVNETKQPNEAILMPYKIFYSLEVNNWYRSLLELIGVDISSTDLVQGYLLYFPLWAMWFWLFELIELAVTLVPKLVYDIYTKLSRSKDE